jgi:hypothetical protein
MLTSKPVTRSSGCLSTLRSTFAHFDHGTVERHFDDVQRIILASTIVVEPYIPCQAFKLHLQKGMIFIRRLLSVMQAACSEQ